MDNFSLAQFQSVENNLIPASAELPVFALEEQLPAAGGPREGGNRRGPEGLSYPHIRTPRPALAYVSGASIIRATKGEKRPQIGGAKRGTIKGFSAAARRRLLYEIAKVKREAQLPNFVTLTYPKEFPSIEQAKMDLKLYQQRLERRFPQCGHFWKLEPQERGAPHFHLLVWGTGGHELLEWTVETWYEIAGNGDPYHKLFHLGKLKDSQPCVAPVRSWRGVWAYAAKYLGKTFEVAGWEHKWMGRFWGVRKRQNIPFGEEKIIEVSKNYVVRVMRYQRKFSKIKWKFRDPNSFSIFCDVDHWIKQLGKEFEFSP